VHKRAAGVPFFAGSQQILVATAVDGVEPCNHLVDVEAQESAPLVERNPSFAHEATDVSDRDSKLGGKVINADELRERIAHSLRVEFECHRRPHATCDVTDHLTSV
jgi:hypothetical protein